MSGQGFITTSWDDGHPLDLRLADLLAKYEIAATFYVPRHAPTGVMSDRELTALAERFEIGAHTIHHVFLDTVSDDIAAREIGDSKTWVEQITGRPCRMFCPPAGKFSSLHARIVREAGFMGLRSVELLSLDFPRRVNGLLVLPTTVQAHRHGMSAYARNALRRRSARNLATLFEHGLSRGWSNLAKSLLQVARKRGGVFHLWGHSWEIEQNGQWAALEEVLRMLGDLCEELPAVSNGELCAQAPKPSQPRAQHSGRFSRSACRAR